VSITPITKTRQLKHKWSTTVLVNEDDSYQCYQMSMPAKPLGDGTSLNWRMVHSQPTREELLTASSIIDSYQYLLCAGITQAEAINRLKCLRKEYKQQFETV